MPASLFNTRDLVLENDEGLSAGALSFSLDEGDVLGLLGSDTRHKSRCCRALALVEPLASGELLLAGAAMTGLDRKSWQALRADIAYINRNTAMMSVLSVMDNMLLPAEFHQRGQRLQLNQKASDWLASLALDQPGLPDSLPAYLSDFEYQACMLLRSLLLKPRLLVLDDCFLKITRDQRQRLIEFAISICAETGAVIILHVQEEELVRAKSTRILYIDESENHFYASIADFLQSAHNSTGGL